MKLLRYLYFLKAYWFKKYPIELTFFVTSRCNFRCQHCFYWKEIDNKKLDELTIEEIEKFTKKVPRLLRLLISGGEPFLRKDLPEICESFYNNTKVLHITIPTNASMPDLIEKNTKKILENCPKAFINISLSLDALGEKRDEIVQVKDSFKKFEETCQRLNKLKKDYKNLGTGVITTMHAKNQKDLIKIYDYATNELKVDNFGFNVVRGSPKDPKIKDIDLEYFKELTKKILDDAQRGESGKMFFPFFKFFLAKRSLLYSVFYVTYTQNKYQIPCYSGRIRGVIDESGKVFPCEIYMYYRSELDFGDLREVNYDFKKIWNSKKAKKIKKNIVKIKCFCTHECDLTTNILFNHRLLPKLLKEWLKLHRLLPKLFKKWLN